MNLSDLKKTLYYKELGATKRAYLHYIDFETKQGRGEWWIQQLLGWFSIEKFIIYSGGLTYYCNSVMHWKVSFYFIATVVVLYMVFRELYPAIIGYFDFGKRGLLVMQNKFMATHPVINPWQKETQETIKAMCEKLGIEDKYKNINE